MWRPKNWLTLYRKFYRISGIESSTRDTFEAGADAMLEGLKQNAFRRDDEHGIVILTGDERDPHFVNRNGWIVLIPDE